MTITRENRIDLIDALRGFALTAIAVIHSLEHFSLLNFPTHLPEWLNCLDKGVNEVIFFLFAGKAYSMFSILFGLSFFIQLRNEEARGGDFRLRFAWRLFLLFLFALLNSAFYDGEILLCYSLMGFVLIPACRLKSRTIIWIGIFCLLQPNEWVRLIGGFINPDLVTYGHYNEYFYAKVEAVQMSGTFLETLKANLTDGLLFNSLWQLEYGRFFHMPALFFAGLLLGRNNLFARTEANAQWWKKALKWAFVALVPLYVLRYWLPTLTDTEALLLPINVMFLNWTSYAFTWVLMSLFVLIWFKVDGRKWQRMLIPYGRMSLSNYIGQSVIGACVYYGFGLGLYAHTGPTYSLLIAIGMLIVQLSFSRWWLNRHRRGPLEELWRRGTWIWGRSAQQKS